MRRIFNRAMVHTDPKEPDSWVRRRHVLLCVRVDVLLIASIPVQKLSPLEIKVTSFVFFASQDPDGLSRACTKYESPARIAADASDIASVAPADKAENNDVEDVVDKWHYVKV